MMKSLNILIVLAICIAVAMCSPVHRQKRRIRPNDQPLTLRELHRQCTHHGWTKCKQRAADMMNPNSKFNKEFTKCNHTALTSKLPDNIIDLDDVRSWCPSGILNKARQVKAREYYCEISKKIFDKALEILRTGLDNPIKGSVKIPSMEKLLKTPSNCLKEKCDDSEERPCHGELPLTNITAHTRLWLKKLGDSRKNCCAGTTFSLGAELHERDEPYACESVKAGTGRAERKLADLWDRHLSEIAELIQAVELMGTIGRRQKCLRGCGNREQVTCVKNSIFPPRNSAENSSENSYQDNNRPISIT